MQVELLRLWEYFTTSEDCLFINVVCYYYQGNYKYKQGLIRTLQHYREGTGIEFSFSVLTGSQGATGPAGSRTLISFYLFKLQMERSNLFKIFNFSPFHVSVL